MTPDWITDYIRMGSAPDEPIYHPRLLTITQNMPKPVFQAAAGPRTPVPKSEVRLCTFISLIRLKLLGGRGHF